MQKHITSLKRLVFIISLLPLSWLIYALLTDQLGANPIEAVTRDTGVWALRFIMVTLLISPLRKLTGINHFIRFRRMLGLFAFFYASVHMLLYLGLDQFFDVQEIWLDIVKRPFITIGFISFVLLIPLTVTSTDKMMKRLGGRRWKKLHYLIYLIVVLSCVHFYMLVKQDKTEPLIYFFIAILLLGFRVFSQRRRSQSTAS
ncbi:MAG TPA: sulfoxide reductase heme-binding subunit YedZ [Methylophaga sp.]|jgi:sulfoxide reductase heme-binding subunit YedZ|uniref:sulfite oxidase heme-binding subunit YedZ n=1 Tax=unclassified Methylophaga TaxID=2629249 RepID=UPI000C8938C5|nr:MULTISPECIES: protein-methionine-sulfoxide reductase heme-binding subunit MsrQ [unclassified Methylophaga]MAP25730.1 sulfoxide reductase heme-binding subunit YedZ [Methylophaga sp.]HAD31160.1 sulfoxide reductase heme-binding subunit YedZ [Methylophaga sp.]HCO00599.1 sulfoxide reductase heme-binding subunit YedZ [Methylophaga sp.]|tara:strand:- start:4228 stop:4830 length:603 start_codon:yes stop_codon:yes gene_type:complete